MPRHHLATTLEDPAAAAAGVAKPGGGPAAARNQLATLRHPVPMRPWWVAKRATAAAEG